MLKGETRMRVRWAQKASEIILTTDVPVESIENTEDCVEIRFPGGAKASLRTHAPLVSGTARHEGSTRRTFHVAKAENGTWPRLLMDNEASAVLVETDWSRFDDASDGSDV